jgi:hypothetical protein
MVHLFCSNFICGAHYLTMPKLMHQRSSVETRERGVLSAMRSITRQTGAQSGGKHEGYDLLLPGLVTGPIDWDASSFRIPGPDED